MHICVWVDECVWRHEMMSHVSCKYVWLHVDIIFTKWFWQVFWQHYQMFWWTIHKKFGKMPKITIFWPKMYISGDTLCWKSSFIAFRIISFLIRALLKCHQICTFWAKSTICLRGLTLFSDDLPTSCFEEKSIKTMLLGVAFSI